MIKVNSSKFYFVLSVFLFLVMNLPQTAAVTPIQQKEIEIDSTTDTLADEFSGIIAGIIDRSFIYGVLSAVNPCIEPMRQYKYILLDQRLMNIQLISFIDEALVLTILDYEQKKIMPDSLAITESESYFSGFDINRPPEAPIFEKNPADSVFATYISVLIQLVDSETGVAIDSFRVNSLGIGRSFEKSKIRASKNFEQTAQNGIKQMYYLFSEIPSADNNRITSELGQDFGLYKGKYFDIMTPNCFREEHGWRIIVPGKRIGLASVLEVGETTHQSTILRLWQSLEPGCWVVEHPSPVFGFQVDMQLALANSYLNLNAQFLLNPLKNSGFGVGVHYLQMRDSYDEIDRGFGFNGFGLWRFMNKPTYKFGFKYGFDLDILFKRDDGGRTVNTLLAAMNTGLSAEIMLSPRGDIVFFAGCRLGSQSDNWDFTEDEETIPATWEGKSPEIGQSDFIMSVGYKLLLF